MTTTQRHSHILTITLLAVTLLLCVRSGTVLGLISPPTITRRGRPSTRGHHRHHHHHVVAPLQMNNFFSDIGDVLTGGKLEPQSGSPPYGQSLGSLSDDMTTFAVQERLLTLTGEDFDVYSVDTNNDNAETPFCNVKGAMLSPLQPKMRIVDSSTNEVLAGLERKFVALTPTYDIYRGDFQEKIGWLEKATIALTETFEFHVEGGFGVFKPPAAYKLEGDFLERRFVMKNDEGQCVAKISEDRIVEFDNMNHYSLRVAPKMDAALVVACCCAIDEELEEEHQKRRERRR